MQAPVLEELLQSRVLGLCKGVRIIIVSALIRSSMRCARTFTGYRFRAAEGLRCDGVGFGVWGVGSKVEGFGVCLESGGVGS